MPRGPRLDAPGTLHHVMMRGIEGGLIVSNDDDRQDFVFRMGRIAKSTGTGIYAWALMTNHAHILLRSGEMGISCFMRKLLTGYATLYNRRHQRHGHLFQNRYKSIVCEGESYFMKLVGYIHLNPFRAGLVSTVDDLQNYRWCGHGMIMNRIKNDWQDRESVLRFFGEDKRAARKAYRLFVDEQSKIGKQDELTGGGLIRSMGGWSEVKSAIKRSERQFSDERILGSGDFVKEVLDQAEAAIKDQIPTSEREAEADAVLSRRCGEAGIAIEALQGGSRRKELARLRKELAFHFVKRFGLSYAETARKLGISTSAVSRILAHAE
ncbi:MAG: transposase [Chlorobiaceae bacterium]